MNREEFINFMNHPDLLDKRSVNDMRELIHEFPYFQTGHLLFLKNLHLLDNIRFPSQLKVSAAHITDREVLYHLLQEKTREKLADQILKRVQEIQEQKDHLSTPGASVSSGAGKSGEVDSAAKPVTDERTTDTQFKEITEAPEEPEREMISMETPPEGGAENETDVPANSSDSIPDPIILIDEEEEIVHHEMSAVDQDQKGEFVDPEIKLSQDSKFSLIGDLLEFEYSRDLNDQVPPPETEAKEKQERPEIGIESSEKATSITNITTTERYSFVVWLDRIQDQETPETKGTISGPQSRRGRNTDLIDRFLDSNQRIISSSEEEEEQEDISIQSVTEDEGLITDTLAQIYIKQGFYSKAIFAYEKLSLKFPEKSRYFASQIEKINNIINKL